ncbi:SH3-like domain-containing protein [Sphingomonas insulae]|uniref:SH3 domain-containing protein n=1 Tax=Sphingomonas insulae TaxID=424800 RepID=A0ABN1HYS5_9SPHN|nr:SH3 domain-containing protein [Sphingomonas insulae]NIJ29453.1 SH3-like domain-containing protein [Sphingomonas insulae]
MRLWPLGRLGALGTCAIAGLAMLAVDGSARAAEAKKTLPYYASISAGRARMRTGPDKTYPASWLYQRADLPVRVIATFKQWRKVEDPDGTQGWMLAALLSERRTAIVRGVQPADMLERPSAGAKLSWRAAPGVVGRLSECGGGWCRLDVRGQAGFVSVDTLWGVEGGERLP